MDGYSPIRYRTSDDVFIFLSVMLTVICGGPYVLLGVSALNILWAKGPSENFVETRGTFLTIKSFAGDLPKCKIIREALLFLT